MLILSIIMCNFADVKPIFIFSFLPMKHLLAAAFMMLAAATASAQAPVQSRVVTDTIHSERLGAPRAYSVYLPAGWDQDTSRTYPVLYLLHGMWGNNNGWFADQRATDVLDQLIVSGEAEPMVVISPYAGGNPYEEQNGYYNIEGWPYEDFFFEEFMPAVEKRFRAGGSKEQRAIAGLSMGGGGATGYAQHHPELFGAAYAMSALMDIPQAAVQPHKPGDKMAILTQSVVDNSCVGFVRDADEARKQALRTVDWFVDCGDDDFLLDRNIDFVQAMHRAGIPVQFRVRDGGHTNEYWHTALYTCLPFVSRHFRSGK